MEGQSENLVGRLDRLGVTRLARAEGLPEELADRVAQVVVQSGLSDDRREEVYRELVAHFEDGLAAGRSPAQLLAAFGDSGRAASLIHRAKQAITPEERGGSGRSDGIVRRLARDLRYAARRLAARPLFTATAVLSLAIGIGANTAMFTLVNEVILRPPPVRDPDRLVEAYLTGPDDPFNSFSYPDYKDFVRGTTAVFEAVGGSQMALAPRDDGDRIERLFGEMVTGNYFSLLGVAPFRGRLIGEADAAAPKQSPVVVLGEGYWRRAFGADPNVIGKSIRLSNVSLTIIGVAPPDFLGAHRGLVPDFYAPLTMIGLIQPFGEILDNRGNHSLFVKARLRPNVTLAQAKGSVDRVAEDLRQRREDGWRKGDGFTLIPSRDVIVYPPIDRLLAPVAWLVMVVVGLVLILACANLAGFLLARAVDRRKEIAVRLSLGATRGQLVLQLLVETILLSVLGGGLGIVIGRAALRAVVSADLPTPIPFQLQLPLDGRVLAFSILVSVAAGVLFGLLPAFQSTRMELASVIRDESAGGGRHRSALRGILVGGQVAVAVVLLIGAGLFVRSLDATRSVDLGFGIQPTGLVVVGVPGTLNSAAALVAIEQVERRVLDLPGIVAVGAGVNVPLNNLNTTTISINVAGLAPPPGRDGHSVDRNAVDSGFVNAMGIRLLKGRNFTALDNDSTAAVAIVNEAFAARFFPGRDPIGQEFRSAAGVQFQIVGMVATTKIRSIAEDARPAVYTPYAREAGPPVWLVARSTGDAEQTLNAVVRRIRETDPDLMILEQRTLARHVQIQTLPLKLGATMLGAFALLALGLASVGLYGTVSYSVAQRTREVGIRLSLGAGRRSVVRLLLWGGLKLVLTGALVGVLTALVLAQGLRQLLVGVGALDPVTFVAVPLVLIVVAAVAAYVPARRAGQVDPVRALKSE